MNTLSRTSTIGKLDNCYQQCVGKSGRKLSGGYLVKATQTEDSVGVRLSAPEVGRVQGA